MKIAYIGQKGIPAKQGGVEKHVEELAIRMAQAGFDVTVYSQKHYTLSDAKKYQGVKIINLPSIKTKYFNAITHTFVATIHALFQDYDVIHYHSVGPSLLAWIPRVFKPRIKVIVTFHCIDRQHQKWGGFAKFILGVGEWTACYFPHQTITVSKTLQRYCQWHFRKQTVYIPNGAPTKNHTQNEILNQYGLEKNNYILAVSRLVPHKGLHTLIQAYQKISNNKKLVIIGDSANTEDYVSRLLHLAGANQNIIFTGLKTGADLTTLFKNAYLFVQPSETEGMSIALLEAIAYGVPTLVSDIKENKEVIDGLGLQFHNKNFYDLARQLEFALRHPAFLAKQAEMAKKLIRTKYNWEDIARQTIELYEQTVSGEYAYHKILKTAE